jgi:hydrogenase maturation factor HypF (carbamoyltransferase family)
MTLDKPKCPKCGQDLPFYSGDDERADGTERIQSMRKYLVSGDIISGAFYHVIEAESSEEAERLVSELPVSTLDAISPEREFPRVTSVEEHR